MYNAYTKYCESNGYEIYSKRKIGANFPTYGFVEGSKKINGKTERFWAGVQFNLNNNWVKNNLKIEGITNFS